MERLKEALVEAGISSEALNGMDEDKLKGLARAMGLNLAEFLPREVQIVTNDKNGARYVQTENFVVPKFRNKKPVEGETSQARNLYMRVEAIDQAISDLLRAKELLSTEE